MLNVKKLLTKILNGFGVVRSSGSATISAAQMYTLATITLPARGEYFIFADLGDGVATTHLCYVNINVTGSPSVVAGVGSNRNNINNGGVVNTWKYVKTDSTACTAQLRTYGYYTTGNTSSGNIIAVKLGGGTA